MFDVQKNAQVLLNYSNKSLYATKEGEIKWISK